MPTDEFRVSSPLHFVPTLEGLHLDVLRTRYIHLATGEGKWENIGESWGLANVLGAKGIPNRVDSWGPDWHHDWVTWRAMMPKYLDEWDHIRSPYHIMITNDQHLWVADGATNQMVKYDLNGKYLYSWGTYGSYPGGFWGVHEFSVDADGNLYTAEVFGGRQQKFRPKKDADRAKLIEEMGVETLMWGSDYPHPDGVWPESTKYIEEQFAGLPPEAIHQITCENAGKFYGLIN